MSRQGGDDLDDDFIPDDLVALSDEEEVGPDDDVAGLLSADEGEGNSGQPSTAQTAATEKKRKRQSARKAPWSTTIATHRQARKKSSLRPTCSWAMRQRTLAMIP